MNILLIIIIIVLLSWSSIKLILGFILFLFVLSYFEPKVNKSINKFTELFNMESFNGSTNLFKQNNFLVNKLDKEVYNKPTTCVSCDSYPTFMKYIDNRSSKNKTDTKLRNAY
jgi:hypothetical protein